MTYIDLRQIIESRDATFRDVRVNYSFKTRRLYRLWRSYNSRSKVNIWKKIIKTVEKTNIFFYGLNEWVCRLPTQKARVHLYVTSRVPQGTMPKISGDFEFLTKLEDSVAVANIKYN